MTSNLLFEYQLTDGIHHFTTLEKTGAAVKALLEYAEGLLNTLPDDETARILVDFRLSGVPPIAEGVVHLLAFFRRQGHKKQMQRIAYLYPRAAQSHILTGFLGIQRFLPQGVITRFFREDEEEKARAWLQTV